MFALSVVQFQKGDLVTDFDGKRRIYVSANVLHNAL